MSAVAEVPERSFEQRISALVRANAIRSFRADLKRDLKAGRASGGRLLRQPPAELETMKVLDLLLAMPKIGRVKALGALGRAGVSPSKTVGGLTDRQREALVVAMPRLRG